VLYVIINLHVQFSKPITGKGNEVRVERRAHEENDRRKGMRAHLRKGSAHLVMQFVLVIHSTVGTKQEGCISSIAPVPG
jgi:hypothetical protein